MKALPEADLAALTEQYGGMWGVCHAQRIMHMVEILAEGASYDKETITLAAYLHDWGGYAQWMVQGVEHQVRSREVAESFLREQGCDTALAARVLECIEYHHGGPEQRSFESRLFTDADALDLLGVVGVCRIFAMSPRDIRAGYARVKYWRDLSMKAITLEPSKKIAQQRLDETQQLLKSFEEETFGLF